MTVIMSASYLLAVFSHKNPKNQFSFQINRTIIVIWIITITFYKKNLIKMIYYASYQCVKHLLFSICHSIPRIDAEKI